MADEIKVGGQSLWALSEGEFLTPIEGTSHTEETMDSVTTFAEVNRGLPRQMGGRATMQLSEAIKQRMEETGESYSTAELEFVQTPAGRKLWEASRLECLER